MENKISSLYIRTSLAGVMMLKLMGGRFFRDAYPRCLNLLLSYEEGCYGSCAYCGLSFSRSGNFGEKTFIRVDWPLYPFDEILRRIIRYESKIKRICISMINHPYAYKDLLEIGRKLRKITSIPLSALISPMCINKDKLITIKENGFDILGVGLDAPSKRVFEKRRGSGVKASLRWERYVETLIDGVEIFGDEKVSCHIVVGLGETDKELVDIFFFLKRNKIMCHLFSFTPEKGTVLEKRRTPSMKRYRRIQLIRYMVEKNHILSEKDIRFDNKGRISSINIDPQIIHDLILTGKPFMTSGCPDLSGELACNRPFAHTRPGKPFRNYPFLPQQDDIGRILKEIRIEEILLKEDKNYEKGNSCG